MHRRCGEARRGRVSQSVGRKIDFDIELVVLIRDKLMKTCINHAAGSTSTQGSYLVAFAVVCDQVQPHPTQRASVVKENLIGNRQKVLSILTDIG